MKMAAVAGMLLIVVGAILLAYQGFTYTTHKKVLQVGPVEATKKEHRTVDLPPIVGAAVLAGGIVLVYAGVRKR